MKFLVLAIILLFCFIGGELWFYTSLNQKQKTAQKNFITPKSTISPTIQPVVDPFKQKPWQLTDIHLYSGNNGSIEAAIVAVEKSNSSSSEFSVRLKNNETDSIQINPETKFYSRTILESGYSKTKQEDIPFSIIDNMLLLLTWKQNDSIDGQIIPLTITRQL